MLNEKGFNLFTALVSFVLIILAMLLIGAMINTERTTTDIISDLEEQAEMQAVADLARADALQVFNFGIRYQIEQFLTDQENYIYLSPNLVTWNEIKKEFARANFGGERTLPDGTVQQNYAFANRTATHLHSIFTSSKTRDIKSFRLSLVSNQERLFATLKDLFKESIEQDDFFEVVDCERGDYEDCVGTFYVNLNVEKLNDAAYEGLPQIEVRNIDTGRVLREPILPRGNFRIFVPLRVFKAIAGARKVMHTADYSSTDASDSTYIRSANDYGLFSARIHNEFEEFKLGLCDPGVCVPRDNPYQPPNRVKDSGVECAYPNATVKPVVTVDVDTAGVKFARNVNMASEEEQRTVLQQMAKDRLDFLVDAAKPTDHDGMLVGDVAPTQLQALATPLPSKIIRRGSGGADSGSVPSVNLPNQDYGSPGSACTTIQEGFGVFFDSDGEGNDEPGTGERRPVEVCVPPSTSAGFCTELTQLEVNLAFEETNDKYKVSKNVPGGHVYRIRLADNSYYPFTVAFEKGVGPGASCSLAGPPFYRGCPAADVMEREWTCISNDAGATGGTASCSPTGP